MEINSSKLNVLLDYVKMEVKQIEFGEIIININSQTNHVDVSTKTTKRFKKEEKL